MCDGKSFHIHAPVTGKARRPTVESLTAGTDYRWQRTEVFDETIQSIHRDSKM